jgi:hypothetical protein
MTTLALLASAPRAFRETKIGGFVTDFLAGIAEGRALADRYDHLARKSDAELAQLGFSRQDIPHVVMFGRTH